MKILKNLLGENAKIHGDSIFLESGSNDDGIWVKLPDGTKFCAKSDVELVYDSTTRLAKNWDFPILFTGKPVVLPVQENTIPIESLKSGTFGTGADINYANIRYFTGTGLTAGINDKRVVHVFAIGR